MPSVCKECQKPIPDAANVCTECNLYQVKWKNELKYWSGIVGLFALVASAVAFTTGFSNDLYRRMMRSDVAMTDFNTFGDGVIWNSSEDVIWIYNVQTKLDRPLYNLLWEVNHEIKPKSSVTIAPAEIAKNKWRGKWADVFGGKPGNYITDPTFFKSLTINEYIPVFFFKDSQTVAQMKEEFPSIPSAPCDMTVNYRKLSSEAPAKQQMPCIVLYRATK